MELDAASFSVPTVMRVMSVLWSLGVEHPVTFVLAAPGGARQS